MKIIFINIVLDNRNLKVKQVSNKSRSKSRRNLKSFRQAFYSAFYNPNPRTTDSPHIRT